MKKFLTAAWRTLFAKPLFRNLNEILFECSLRGLGIRNNQDDSTSGETHFVRRLLPRYVEPDSWFIDAGANLGGYSTRLTEVVAGDRIVAFEPNPANYARLDDRLRPCGVTTVQAALGESRGTATLFDRADRGGASVHGTLYQEVIENIHKVESSATEITVRTLDDYAQEQAIEHITLLKIDTEGHELQVLRGASKMISEGRISLIQIEFNEMNIVSRVFYRDFVNALPDYRAYRLLPRGVIPMRESALKTELFAFQNIVFVHKRFNPDRRMRPANPAMRQTVEPGSK